MDTRRVQSEFYSPQNESRMVAAATQEVQRRIGRNLDERQSTRLERTVTHYMDEVWEKNGPQPIQQLNREVVNVTLQDFNTYMRRTSAEVSQNVAVQRVVNMPQRPIYNENAAAPLMLDTGDRFDQMQQERNQVQGKPPRVPDFRINLEDDLNAPSALSQYEIAKRQREEEAARAAPQTLQQQGQALQQFQQQQIQQQQRDLIIPTQTNFQNSLTAAVMEGRAPAAHVPDPNGNPTIALAGTTDPRPNLQQDVIIKQDSILSYKEIEENLFVYSADRDWLNNPTQSRYNFTVNFDVANNRPGFGIGTAVNKKFKNIVRIELVKAILPVEGLETVMQNTAALANPQLLDPDTSLQINALSFPYVIVRIPELDVNNYGTDNYLDNAFAVIQYDANWNTDNTNLTDSRGYLAMIPKFLKCQKVYSPTPLSTLTKLSFQLLRPSGAPLSDISDSLRVAQVLACTNAGAITTGTVLSGQNNYIGAKLNDNYDDPATGSPLYYIIRTYEAFSRFAFSKGDRISVKGLDFSGLPAANQRAAGDLASYIQNQDGLIVVSTGWYTGLATSTSAATSGAYTSGLNAAGYANFIVVQAPWAAPTGGSSVTTATPYIPEVVPFGGTDAANLALATQLAATTLTTGRILNLSHQVQLVFRIITREMDPTMRVRADNI